MNREPAARKPAARRRRARLPGARRLRKLFIEPLEDRRLLAQITVTNLDDNLLADVELRARLRARSVAALRESSPLQQLPSDESSDGGTVSAVA